MKEHKPDIFQYAEYRLFLSDLYRYFKSHEPKFSHRFIALKIGAGSAGWFADVAAGRISLTGAFLLKLATLFKLSNKEKNYFELLVAYDQAGSLDEKNAIMEKLMTFKELNAFVVSKDQFAFYNTWYISAIRELLFVFDFKDNYKALAKKLNPSITPLQAKKAVEILHSLGFIKTCAGGTLKPCVPIIKKDSQFKSLHWANYMRANLELSVSALERFEKEQRDISTVTVCLSEDGMRKASEEIGQLRKRLLALSENDTTRNKVFQCNVQLFPLTR